MGFWSKARVSLAIVNGIVVGALVLLGLWLMTQDSQRDGDAAAAFGVAANVLVASVLVWVTYNYVVVTEGLLSEAARERKDRRTQLLTERARNVSGHLDVVWSVQFQGQPVQHDVGHEEALLGQMQPGANHGRALKLTLINAGPLPVRAVRGIAYEGTTTTVFHEFDVVPVLLSGKLEFYVWVGAQPPVLKLELEYDDDDSRRWRKYGSAAPLELLHDPYAAQAD